MVGTVGKAIYSVRSESLKESIDATESLEGIEILGVDEI